MYLHQKILIAEKTTAKIKELNDEIVVLKEQIKKSNNRIEYYENEKMST